MLKGKVSILLRDKQGNIKYSKTGKNTITTLGKMMFMYGGCGELFTGSLALGNQYGTDNQTGTPNTNQTVIRSGGVKNWLLNSERTWNQEKTILIPKAAEIQGFCTTATALTGVNKEGIRLPAKDPTTNTNLITADGKIAATYQYTSEVSGDINVIAMTVPPAIVEHLLGEDIKTKDQYYNYVHYFPILPYLKGCGKNDICFIQGAGTDYAKKFNITDMSLSEFTPESGSPYSANYLNAIEFNGYYIYLQQNNKNTLGSCVFTVVNKTTGNHYDKLMGFDNTRGFFLIIEGTHLYAAQYGGSCYEITIDEANSNVTLTSVTASQHIDTNYLVQDVIGYPIKMNDEYKYIMFNSNSGYATCHIIDDIKDYDSKEFVTNTADLNVYLDKFSLEQGWIFDGTQLGNLFSYFILEDTIEKEAEDTLTVTYYYELEDQV